MKTCDGRSHRADLVAAPGAGDFTGYVAAGQPRHGGGEVDDRLADAAANHHDQCRAGGGHRDEDRERDQEAEARGGIVGAEDLLGVVVEGVTHIDDGAKGDLGFGIEEVDIMFVFA